MSTKRRGKVENGVRWVKIHSLISAAGQELNGKIGKVATDKLRDGRFEVHVEWVGGIKLLKPSNIEDVPEADLVSVQRLPCNGEGLSTEQLLFPREHEMFQEGGAHGNCPAFALCGFPLQLHKAKPRETLRDQAEYDNQLATYAMIEPRNGFAPMSWQSYVGPVYMYRANGMADLTEEDMDIVEDFLNSLIDQYGEGPEFDPSSWLNPDFFNKFCQEYREDAADSW